MISTNQTFIEFQTRAIFIFEQSQVGCARSELRPGSSPLCAIRATVVSSRRSPLLTGWSLSHLPFPSFFPSAPWIFAWRRCSLGHFAGNWRRARARSIVTCTHCSTFFIVYKQTRRHLVHHTYPSWVAKKTTRSLWRRWLRTTKLPETRNVRSKEWRGQPRWVVLLFPFDFLKYFLDLFHDCT